MSCFLTPGLPKSSHELRLKGTHKKQCDCAPSGARSISELANELCASDFDLGNGSVDFDAVFYIWISIKSYAKHYCRDPRELWKSLKSPSSVSRWESFTHTLRLRNLNAASWRWQSVQPSGVYEDWNFQNNQQSAHGAARATEHVVHRKGILTAASPAVLILGPAHQERNRTQSNRRKWTNFPTLHYT